MKKYNFKEIVRKLKDKNGWEYTKPNYNKYAFEDEVIYKKDEIVFYLNQYGITFRDYNSREIVYVSGIFAYIIITYYTIKLKRFLKNQKKGNKLC